MGKITKAVRLQLAKMLQMYQEIKIEDGRTFSIEGDLAVGEEIFVANESGEFEPVPDGVYKTTDGQLITVEAGKVAVIEAAPADPAADPSDPEPMADPEPDPDPAADPSDDVQALKDRIAELENENADLKAKNAELEAKIAELEQLRKQSAANPIDSDPEPDPQPKGNKFVAYAHKHQ